MGFKVTWMGNMSSTGEMEINMTLFGEYKQCVAMNYARHLHREELAQSEIDSEWDLLSLILLLTVSNLNWGYKTDGQREHITCHRSLIWSPVIRPPSRQDFAIDKKSVASHLPIISNTEMQLLQFPPLLVLYRFNEKKGSHKPMKNWKFIKNILFCASVAQKKEHNSRSIETGK